MMYMMRKGTICFWEKFYFFLLLRSKVLWEGHFWIRTKNALVSNGNFVSLFFTEAFSTRATSPLLVLLTNGLFVSIWALLIIRARFEEVLGCKKKKWKGLVTLLKRRPSRPDVFHFEQTSNCLDNLVTFSAFFFYYIFQMIYHHLKLFSVKGQRVCTYFLKKKHGLSWSFFGSWPWPPYYFYGAATLRSSIYQLFTWRLWGMMVSLFFWDLGFII